MNGRGMIKQKNKGIVNDLHSSWWDIGGESHVNWSDANYTEREIFPDGNNSGGVGDSEVSVVYRFSSSASHYSLLHRSYLRAEVEVSSNTATAYNIPAGGAGAAAQWQIPSGVSGINLINRATLSMNGIPVETVTNVKDTALVRYLTEVPATKQNEELFVPDSGDNGDLTKLGTKPAALAAASADTASSLFNEGVVSKLRRSTRKDATTRVYEFLIPLQAIFPLIHEHRRVWNGKIEISLDITNRANGGSAFYCTGQQPKHTINRLALHHVEVKPSDPMKLALDKYFISEKQFTLGWNSWVEYTGRFGTKAGTTTIDFHVANLSMPVNRVYMLVRSSADLTAEQDNSYVLPAVQNAYLEVQGKSIPSSRNYNTYAYGDKVIYQAYLDSIGCGFNSGKDAPISYTQWKLYYQVIPFDLRYLDKGDYSDADLTNLLFHGEFATADGNQLIATALLESHRYLYQSFDSGRRELYVEDARGQKS